jgi:methylmalonyl-CoA decarboxylase subunit alpha
MWWQKEVDELRRRQQMAEAMGGAEGVARQRRAGKLTARERIAALADPGSFREFMALSGAATYEDGELLAFTPKPFVDGTITLDGRKAIVTAGDFKVRGGSAGRQGGMGRELAASQRAIEWLLPYIRLLDASGGSVRTFEEYGRTYLPDGNAWTIHDVRLLSLVPTVSAVLGSVAGLPAVNACLSHFSLMVKDINQIFPGGPPVVKAALGIDITKEELGGDHIHTRISSCIDNPAETEADAFDQIRRFLSFLPQSVNELAPRGPADDDPDRAEEALLSIVPRSRRQIYDARKLLGLVVDRGSFFETASLCGRARITGLARIDGYPVAVMANNPRLNGGATDVAAGRRRCGSCSSATRSNCLWCRWPTNRASWSAPTPNATGSNAPAPGWWPPCATAACRGSPSSLANSMASPDNASTARPACIAVTPGRRPIGARCTSPAASPPTIVARSPPPPTRRRSARRSRRGCRRSPHPF